MKYSVILLWSQESLNQKYFTEIKYLNNSRFYLFIFLNHIWIVNAKTNIELPSVREKYSCVATVTQKNTDMKINYISIYLSIYINQTFKIKV